MKRFVAELLPWAGLMAGFLAWGVHQQTLADVLRFDCGAISPTRAVVSAIVALALCVAGAALSWRVVRTGGEAGGGHPFVAWLSILGAGIFALAILMQAMASLTVPGCFR
jgi:hypothetical protein